MNIGKFSCLLAFMYSLVLHEVCEFFKTANDIVLNEQIEQPLQILATISLARNSKPVVNYVILINF